MTRRADHPSRPGPRHSLFRWLAVALLLLPATLATAQPVRVGAGEHAGFTRVVLMAAQPFDWHHAPGAHGPVVTLGGSGPVDLARAFDRIGRDRLTALSLDGRVLSLHLGCRCEARVWQERPGLVVIDLLDPTGDSPAEDRSDAPPGAHPPAPDAAPHALARSAGAELARSLSTRPEAPDPPPQPDPALYRDAVAALSSRIAASLGEGLLDPASGSASASMILPPATAPDALPRPLHVTSAAGEAPVRDDPAMDGRCALAPALDFLSGAAETDFPAAFAPLIRNWTGEFDQPDPEITLQLARLFLRNGFGAEARAVIDRASAPVEGRVLLLGFADLLEERQSNARHLLARQIGCGGHAGLLATLAGAGAAEVRAQATETVIAWQQMPAPLQLILGPDLARRLIESGAVEGGRVITGALRRLTDPPPPEVPLLEALAEQARGDLARAAGHLDAAGGSGPAAVLARLELALSRAETLPQPAIADAVALAMTLREAGEGRAIMAAAARQHLLAGEAEAAFALIDRLDSWAGGSRGSDSLVATLRDEAWQNAAAAPDLALLTLVLSRDDWRTAPLSAATRAALADRLRALGLTEQAAMLDRPGEAGQTLEAQTGAEVRESPATATGTQPLLSGGSSGRAGPMATVSDLAGIPAPDSAALAATPAQSRLALPLSPADPARQPPEPQPDATTPTPTESGAPPPAERSAESAMVRANPDPPAVDDTDSTGSPPTLTAQPPGALALAAALMAESAALRGTIGELLATPPPARPP